jgi:hypothetical protein
VRKKKKDDPVMSFVSVKVTQPIEVVMPNQFHVRIHRSTHTCARLRTCIGTRIYF